MNAGDEGNYSVVVLIRSADNNVTTYRRFVQVIVSDGLQTTDKQLKVTQQPVAEYDNTTNQYHVVLRCGTFIHPTQPPFEVNWQTPSGQTQQSSGYKDGSFLLSLPNPVEGGPTPAASPSAACLHGNRTGEASLTVDGMEARLSLLEARKDTGSRDVALEARVQQLENKLNDLSVQYTTLKAENGALRVLLNRTVSFHARLNATQVDLPVGSALVLPTVVTNHGDAYDNLHGVFTAPYSGTYCFLATTEDNDTARWSALSLMVDDAEVDYVDTNAGMIGVPATVHAVVDLAAGQRVWLRVPYDTNSYWARQTAFSGFLLMARA